MTAPAGVLAPLLEWARLPGAARVLAAARSRLEAGHAGDRVRIPVTLTAADRAHVGRLLGLSWAAAGRDVTLGLLRSACAGSGTDLEQLLVAVGGPLRDLRAEKAAQAARTLARRDSAAAALAAAGLTEPVIALLLARPWLGPVDDPAFPELAAALATLIGYLPAGGMLLANLAHDLYDDPHALDRDRPLGRAAARVLAAHAANAAGADGAGLAAAAARVGTAAGWRAAWAGAGVSCDTLSSTVLALNVPVPHGGATGALLRVAAEVGEPVWLTARTLRAGWPPAPGSLAGVLVRVCENPSVLEAAADQLGAQCPPLVCTYGRPSLAAWELLDGLTAAGAAVEVSADRDAAGQAILTDLLTRLPSATRWLPAAGGLFEEQRLPGFLDDLRRR
ncbi:MAG TPA: TIGR02679 domain-containing protein [Frankiaceae bacterium]